MRTACVGLIIALLVGVAGSSPVPQGTAKWVTLKGKIVWPANKPIPDEKYHTIAANSPDGLYTLRGGPVLDDKLLVHAKSRGLKNVVVWLRPDNDRPAATAPFPTEMIHPSLTKPKSVKHTVGIVFCRYDRRVLAVRVGDTLEFINTDVVPNNVKFNGQTNDFNVLVPAEQSYTSNPLVAASGPAMFSCSIHWWMAGFARVFDHPYYAVTDENGNFEMKLVPVGKWRMMYWHEFGFHKGAAGKLGYPIEVKDDGGAKRTLPPLEYLPAEN